MACRQIGPHSAPGPRAESEPQSSYSIIITRGRLDGLYLKYTRLYRELSANNTPKRDYLAEVLDSLNHTIDSVQDPDQKFVWREIAIELP